MNNWKTTIFLYGLHMGRKLYKWWLPMLLSWHKLETIETKNPLNRPTKLRSKASHPQIKTNKTIKKIPHPFRMCVVIALDNFLFLLTLSHFWTFSHTVLLFAYLLSQTCNMFLAVSPSLIAKLCWKHWLSNVNHFQYSLGVLCILTTSHNQKYASTLNKPQRIDNLSKMNESNIYLCKSLHIYHSWFISVSVLISTYLPICLSNPVYCALQLNHSGNAGSSLINSEPL